MIDHDSHADGFWTSLHLENTKILGPIIKNKAFFLRGLKARGCEKKGYMQREIKLFFI